MNLRQILFTILAMFASLHTAQAGDITVRNKTIHDVTPLWVAEYSVGASKAERVAGPWQIFSGDERTWDKSAFVVAKERWVRWAVKKSDLDPEYSKSAWDNVGADIGKKSIGSFVGNINISDRDSKGTYQAKTDTAEWIGTAWAGTWDSIWGPLSTAGQSLTVTNETDTTYWFGEYQKKPLGVASKLQGGWELKPGASKTITRAKLSPGYTERYIRWGGSAANISDSFEHSFFETLNGRQACGAGYKAIHIFFDKNGVPEGYSDLLWKSKEYFRCTFLVDVLNAVATAGQYVKIPDGLGTVLGLDALLQPVQNAATNAVNLDSLESALNARVTPLFPDAQLAQINQLRSKIATMPSNASFRDLFKSDCFCSSEKKAQVLSTLTNLGLKAASWPIAQSSGHFYQGYTMTIGVQYKALTINVSQSLLTDYGTNTNALFSFGVGGGTSVTKTPSISRTYSTEIYPSIGVPTVLDVGWNFGVMGNLPGPLAGGGSALFGTNGQVPYIPDLTKLVGLSFAGTAASATNNFSASGGVGWTWKGL